MSTTDTYELDLGPDDADITRPETFQDGVPHATFRRLRDEDPVSWWDEHDGGRGFWAVTRYEDYLRVSREVETFCSREGIRLEEMSPEEADARRTMMEMDPPVHTRYRRLVSKPFSRREVFTYEASIRELARAVVDRALPESRTLDFTEEIAKQLPMRMLGRLMGVPDEDGPWLVERGDALLGNTDPEMTAYPVGLVDTEQFRMMPFRSPIAYELFDYAQHQADLRREHPTGDVISLLLQPMVDGERLTDVEFKNLFALMVAAGNDTTRYTMAAAMKALVDHPNQMAELRDAIVRGDDGTLEVAVEEILRYATVTMHFRRTATHDTELRGRRISAGDKVVMWLISADFDERQFPDPYRFDIHRTPNDHVAFGRQSPHLCLGAQLARLEIKVLLQELLPRLADARLAGPVERLRSNFVTGMKHLPVHLTLA